MLSLSQGLERLTERHNQIGNTNAWNAQDQSGSLPSAVEEGWPRLGVSTATQSLLNTVLAYRSKFVVGDQMAYHSCMYIAMLSILIPSYTDYALYSRTGWAR